MIVRYLAGDDPEQARRAKSLIGQEDIFVCVTVLLEAEWVLRRLFGYDRRMVIQALRRFAGLEHVTIEDAGPVSEAFDWAERGKDFADALHLARTAHLAGFVTFDRGFIRLAGRLAHAKVGQP